MIVIAGLGVGGYFALQNDLLPLPGALTTRAEIAEAASDLNGLARVESASGVYDFQVTSGLTGERLVGVRLKVAVAGPSRMLYAEDPTGVHLPLAVPLTGETTVRRLTMPPRSGLNYNIASAAGPLEYTRLAPLGTLTEAGLRDRLRTGGDRSVLIYLYNPMAPLALTGAALEAYATPFENVTVLRPGVDDPGATGLVIVGLNRDVYDSWAHIAIDRYLAGRVGQAAGTTLGGDLDLAWAYPVFDVFPAEPTLDLGAGDTVTFQIRWRSQNPDPPPPWSLFVSSPDEGQIAASPESFPLSPEQPQQEVTVTVDRTGLPVGEHTVTVIIQPFSDTFGLIQQTVQREIRFTVAEALPTPTPGPGLQSLEFTPLVPREGDRLTITAQGFEPGEAVLLEFIGPERSITDSLAVADPDGVYHYEIDLSTVPAGSYSLTLTGQRSTISGQITVPVGAGIADGVVDTGELNLRTEPDYSAPVLEILVRGDELTVLTVNGDDTWYEVVTKTGIQGWVDAKLIKLNIDSTSIPWNPLYPAP